jgi:polysaccharide export outer membrane protein
MRSTPARIGAGLFLAVLTAFCAAAQQPAQTAEKPDTGYVLGPDDQIVIHALDSPEISEKPFLIGMNGNLTLPLIGRVEASGLTVEQLEAALDARLKKYVKDPQVAVSVSEFRSQPISVFGAVTKPGVYQLRGRKTLYEVLSMAGGPGAGGPTETTGSSLTLTRRRENGEIPLPSAKIDATGQFSTVELNVQDILDGKDPAANIVMKPNDTISVSEANSKMIYVVGDVEHGGAFSLGGRERLSVLRALSLAGGLGRTARPDKARIIRGSPGGAKPQEIAVNITRVFNGKAEDIALLPQDVLVVPTSSRKVFSNYTLPSVVSAAAYAAIYHF